jgi:hypothetical protein
MADDADSEQTDDWAALAAKVWAAGTGAALGLPFGPPGAIGGAALGALLEPVARNLLKYLSGDARRRSGEVLSAACEASEFSTEDTLARMFSDEKSRLLAGTAIVAAAHTAWEDKVRTLGSSLASGLLASDDAEVDIEQMIMLAIADLEAPQLALLDLLVAWRPPLTVGERDPVRLDIPEYSHSRLRDRGWSVNERKWQNQLIRLYRPRLAPVLSSLVGSLQRHGLALFEDNSDREIEQLKEAVENEATRRDQEQRSGRRQRRSMTAFKVEPVPGTWEPTELGEQVWLRFRDAGAKVPDVWASSPRES